MRIARYTDGGDPTYGLVDGAGEKIAQISGDPLYTKIELTGVTATVDRVRLLAPVIPRSKIIAVVSKPANIGSPSSTTRSVSSTMP